LNINAFKVRAVKPFSKIVIAYRYIHPMKKALLLLICWRVFSCYAQPIDTTSRLAATYFKEAETAAKNQKLWAIDFYGPIMFVDQQSRITYANMPDSAGILKKDGEIYKGFLPKDVMVANTALHWGGRLWSVILWPLPQNYDDRLNLVMHESFHRVQVRLGLPMHNPTAAHLSTLYGRIYFLLELQALRDALSKPVNQRQNDLTSALLFRAKRAALFPRSFGNERLLEMNEGLAEYTGVMLGRPKDSIIQHLYQVIAHAASRQSLIRSAPYITGPIYGYLLYQQNPEWTLKIDSNASFPALTAANYHLQIPADQLDKEVDRRSDQYDGKTIISCEKQKEAIRQKKFNDYVSGFTKQPVLTIKLIPQNFVFDPNNLFDLGEYGTVYPTAQLKDSWGELIVSDNGVLMKDWAVITLMVGEGTSVNGQVITGKGWQISLNHGWKMIKIDELHYKLAK